MGYIKNDNANKLKRKRKTPPITSFLLLSTMFILICSIIKTLTYFSSFKFQILASIAMCAVAVIVILLFIFYFSGSVFENKGFFSLLALFCYMLVIGAVRTVGFSAMTPSYLLRMLIYDLCYCSLFLLGAIFANKRYFPSYIKIMKVLGVIAFCCGILSLLMFSYKDAMSTFRGGGLWSKPYCLWWMTYAVFSFAFAYARIKEKNRFLGYSLFILYFVIGVLFLKRIVVVECATLLIATSFLKNYNGKRNTIKYALKLTSIITAIILAVVLFFVLMNAVPFVNVIVTNITERFESYSLSSYDRTSEFSEFISDSSFDQILFGYGIGNYKILAGDLPALHIGIANAIFKGGIPFVLFWVYVAIKTVKMIANHKILSDEARICVCVTAVAIVSSFFAFSWSYTLGIFGFAAPIIYVIQYTLPKKEKTRLLSRAPTQKQSDCIYIK